MKKEILLAVFVAVVFVGCGGNSAENIEKSEELKNKQVALGKALFFDTALSKNKTQSCATCHNPEHGFVDNRSNAVSSMASLGDDGHSFGDRNAPTASYAMFSPEFHYDKEKKQYIGGQFWDGREKDLKGQAGGPPMNPIEMGMPSVDFVIDRIKANPYYLETFKNLYGEEIFNDPKQAYAALAQAIASFEKTDEFAPFDSKYDRYLRGEYEMTLLEELGMSLFFSNNNTNCSTCHQLKGMDREGETFTNYEYHNIGVPANLALRAKNGVKKDHIDNGLFENPAVADEAQKGKFKVPTLRNVAVTGPYMHNGVFKDLKTVILFYDKFNNPMNKINPETGKEWREGETKETINTQDLKAKKMSFRKVLALEAFLKTLTDKRYEHLLEK